MLLDFSMGKIVTIELCQFQFFFTLQINDLRVMFSFIGLFVQWLQWFVFIKNLVIHDIHSKYTSNFNKFLSLFSGSFIDVRDANVDCLTTTTTTGGKVQ